MGEFVSAALHQTLQSEVAACDEERALTDTTVEAMQGAGLFRVLAPKRVGGDEMGFAAMTRCAREIAAASNPAVWVFLVSTAHDWILGSFSEAAQDDVHGDGPDHVFPGSLANTGEMIETEGGFRLTGHFPWASGAKHGKWFMLGTRHKRGDGRMVPYHTVVPREDLSVDDNWYPIGLRGTGSVTMVADDVFVPAHRAVRTGKLFRSQTPESIEHPNSMFRTPVVPGLSTHLAAALLGMAYPALDHAKELIKSQVDKYTGGNKIDRPGLQMRVAESDVELRMADGLLAHTVGVLERCANGEDTMENRAQARYQAATICEVARRATERLFNATGARAGFDGNRIQQAFRDITMGKTHAMVDIDLSAQAHGRGLLGLSLEGYPL